MSLGSAELPAGTPCERWGKAVDTADDLRLLMLLRWSRLHGRWTRLLVPLVVPLCSSILLAGTPSRCWGKAADPEDDLWLCCCWDGLGHSPST